MSNRSPGSDYPVGPERDRPVSVRARVSHRLGALLGATSPRSGPVCGERCQQIAAVAGLTATQLADLLVTVYGLSRPGVVELNPVAVAAMESLGTVPGLVLLSVVSLGVIVTVTEATVWYCRTTFQPLWVRCLGYTPLTVFSLAVAGYNILLLLWGYRPGRGRAPAPTPERYCCHGRPRGGHHIRASV